MIKTKEEEEEDLFSQFHDQDRGHRHIAYFQSCPEPSVPRISPVPICVPRLTSRSPVTLGGYPDLVGY